MFTGDGAVHHRAGTNRDMYHALGTEPDGPARRPGHDRAAAGYRCGFVGECHVGITRSPADYGNLAKTATSRSCLAQNGLCCGFEPTPGSSPGRQTVAGRWRGTATGAAGTPARMRRALMAETARGTDPLRDRVAGSNRRRRT